jgi:hypothetical protein
VRSEATRAVLSLGSNLGDRPATLQGAVDLLAAGTGFQNPSGVEAGVSVAAGVEPGLGVGRDLQEPGKHGQPVLTDGGGAGFQIRVQRLPGAHLGGVAGPPAPLPRFAGDGHQLLPPVLVNLEASQKFHHHLQVRGHVPVFEPADGLPGHADLLGELVGRAVMPLAEGT